MGKTTKTTSAWIPRWVPSSFRLERNSFPILLEKRNYYFPPPPNTFFTYFLSIPNNQSNYGFLIPRLAASDKNDVNSLPWNVRDGTAFFKALVLTLDGDYLTFIPTSAVEVDGTPLSTERLLKVNLRYIYIYLYLNLETS